MQPYTSPSMPPRAVPGPVSGHGLGDGFESPTAARPGRARRFTRRAMLISGGVALVAALLIVWAVVDRSTIERPEGGMASATIDDIVDSPRLYHGRTVTVVGEVDDAIPSASAFELEDDDVFFEDKLVVINATGQPVDVLEDTAYRVTGTVRLFDREALSVDPNLNLDWQLYADLDAEAVLIATEVIPASAWVSEQAAR
jgi:hypothetical protein